MTYVTSTLNYDGPAVNKARWDADATANAKVTVTMLVLKMTTTMNSAATRNACRAGASANGCPRQKYQTV